MPGSNGTESVHVTHVDIKVNGSSIPDTAIDNLTELIIDSTLYLPTMVEMSFNDEKMELIDSTTFPLGGKLEIDLSPFDDPTNLTNTFKGEIVALEPNFGSGTQASLVVRAYDKSYRLHRGIKTKAWVNIKDSDIAQQIAGGSGLSTEVEATSEVYDHVFQNALSDMEFLHLRAERIGYEVFVDDEKLYFRKQDPTGSAIDLEWGKELRTFTPRLSIANQVNEVTVKGWDPKKKEAITGVASSSSTAPSIGLGQWGGQAAQSAVSSAKGLQVRQPVYSQAEATTLAQGILDTINSSFIEADGTAMGHPEIKAGMLVNLTKLGDKFSGKYKITAIRHQYDQDGFKSRFTVEGAKPKLISTMMQDMQNQPWGGVVTALVVNNNISNDSHHSSDDWGMVKIKYPWLDDSQESFWARIATPGAGADRGLYFLPEVNDEVLVAFEQGDFNHPYIIGGLFNGQDAPPEPISNVSVSGKVKTRIIKTRTGHTIRFVDEDSGQEYIEIIDAKSNTFIKMDAQGKKIQIDSKGDIEIRADQNISITANGKIDIKATQGLTMQGQKVDVTAQSNMTLKATGKMDIQGATLSAMGQSTAEFKGGAAVTIQGALVKIN